ncbi:MAG: hypothetical protein AAF420_12065, partial [Pseudomonadota bacterium]
MSARVFGGLCVVVLIFAAWFASEHFFGEQELPVLEGEEIAEMLTGNTLRGEGFQLYYEADGVMRGWLRGHLDSGTWWVKSDHYCVRWKVWGYGDDLCWYVKREGERIIRNGVGNDAVNH